MLDAWTLDPHPETRTTWLLWGEVEPDAAGRLRLRRPSPGSRDVLIEHDAETVELEVREIDDPVIAHSWGELITRVRLRPPVGARSMTVRFRAADEEQTP